MADMLWRLGHSGREPYVQGRLAVVYTALIVLTLIVGATIARLLV